MLRNKTYITQIDRVQDLNDRIYEEIFHPLIYLQILTHDLYQPNIH